MATHKIAVSVPEPPEPEITPIHDVQGPGASSPITGQTATIEGIVTGIDDEIGASFGNNNTIRRFPEDAGIFVQEEPADADTNPETSEGVFVGFVRDAGQLPAWRHGARQRPGAPRSSA